MAQMAKSTKSNRAERENTVRRRNNWGDTVVQTAFISPNFSRDNRVLV